MPRNKRILKPWNPLAGQTSMGWDEWKLRHAGAGGDAMRKKFEKSTSAEGGQQYLEEWGATAADPLGRLDDTLRRGEVKTFTPEGERVGKRGRLEALLEGIPPDQPWESAPIANKPESAEADMADVAAAVAARGLLPRGQPYMPVVNTPSGTPLGGTYKEHLKETGQRSSALAAGRFLSGQGKKVTPKMRAAMQAAAAAPKSKKKGRPTRER